MKPADIRDLGDVERWLRHYVEWNDEHSRDMALRALEVIRDARVELDALKRTGGK